jgi:predicted amidohydrolase
MTARAADKIREAAAEKAQVIVLPECFNSPFGTKFFPEYAEEIPEGQTRYFKVTFAQPQFFDRIESGCKLG